MVEELCRWLPVNEFSKTFYKLCPDDSADFFCRSANQPFRDASLALMFAKACHARKLKLEGDQCSDVDFSMELRNGELMMFQSTEADRRGRRRADEYRELKSSGYPSRIDPGEEWEIRRNSIPDALNDAISLKLSKHYQSNDLSLLIYLNLGTYGCWKQEIEKELVMHTQAASNSFHSVWVYWSGHPYRCWPNPFIGTADSFRPGPRDLEGISKLNPLENFFDQEDLFSRGRGAW